MRTYSNFDYWTTLSGERIRICDLEDTHLANIIKFVCDRPLIYPEALAMVLMLEAVVNRDLAWEFLERAPIPYRDEDGDWCINNRKAML